MSTEQPWKDHSANKREKKKAISGELNRPAGKRKRPRPRRKRADRSKETVQSLCECFGTLEDPRVERSRRHLLIDIVVIAILAVIANSDGWKDIQIWGESQQAWL